jgi:hypothetical protein
VPLVAERAGPVALRNGFRVQPQPVPARWAMARSSCNLPSRASPFVPVNAAMPPLLQ